MERYVIGDIPIVWKGENINLGERGNMSLFLSEEQTDMSEVCFEEAQISVNVFENAEVIKKTGGYELLKINGKLFLMNHWSKNRFGYGFEIDGFDSENTQKIYVNPDIGKDYSIPAERFFSTIGLHRKLLKRNAIILHASYIEYNGKAILFAAASQTGKSTQASLWQKHENAVIINGDRVLLRKKENQWYAYGYPCCGSSKICLNKTLPIGAIVILHQGSENIVESIRASESVSALTSGTEIYTWDNEEIMKVFSLAEKISKEVPVLKLFCRADEGAVSVLKSELKAMKIW